MEPVPPGGDKRSDSGVHLPPPRAHEELQHGQAPLPLPPPFRPEVAPTAAAAAAAASQLAPPQQQPTLPCNPSDAPAAASRPQVPPYIPKVARTAPPPPSQLPPQQPPISSLPHNTHTNMPAVAQASAAARPIPPYVPSSASGVPAASVPPPPPQPQQHPQPSSSTQVIMQPALPYRTPAAAAAAAACASRPLQLTPPQQEQQHANSNSAMPQPSPPQPPPAATGTAIAARPPLQQQQQQQQANLLENIQATMQSLQHLPLHEAMSVAQALLPPGTPLLDPSLPPALGNGLLLPPNLPASIIGAITNLVPPYVSAPPNAPSVSTLPPCWHCKHEMETRDAKYPSDPKYRCKLFPFCPGQRRNFNPNPAVFLQLRNSEMNELCVSFPDMPETAYGANWLQAFLKKHNLKEAVLDKAKAIRPVAAKDRGRGGSWEVVLEVKECEDLTRMLRAHPSLDLVREVPLSTLRFAMQMHDAKTAVAAAGAAGGGGGGGGEGGGGAGFYASAGEVERRYALLPRRFQKSLFDFQKEGVRFALRRNGRCLIGDEMGTGKTLQALAIMACYQEEWPLLIVVPASLRLQWAEVVEDWITFLRPADIHVVFGSTDKIFATSECPPVVITSYEMLRNLETSMTHIGFNCIVFDESHKMATSRTHAAPNKLTAASLRVASLASRVLLLSGTPSLSRPFEIYDQVRLLHSDLLSMPQKPGAKETSKWEYGRNYCTGVYWQMRMQCPPIGVAKYNGVRCGEELHFLLRNAVMIRRLKKDVLAELPPLSRTIVRIEEGKKSKMLGQVLSERGRERGKAAAAAAGATAGSAGAAATAAAAAAVGQSSNGGLKRSSTVTSTTSSHHEFTQEELLMLEEEVRLEEGGEEGGEEKEEKEFVCRSDYHELGRVKLGGAEEWLEDRFLEGWLDAGVVEGEGEGEGQAGQVSVEADAPKYVVFAHHLSVLESLRATIDAVLRKHHALRQLPFAWSHIGIQGSTPADTRTDLVKRFTHDPRCRVALIGITAGGVGLDLAAAATAVFVELPNSPSWLRQAEDRLHRRGQKEKVQVYYLVLPPGSLEDKVWENMRRLLRENTAVVNSREKAEELEVERVQELGAAGSQPLDPETVQGLLHEGFVNHHTQAGGGGRWGRWRGRDGEEEEGGGSDEEGEDDGGFYMFPPDLLRGVALPTGSGEAAAAASAAADGGGGSGRHLGWAEEQQQQQQEREREIVVVDGSSCPSSRVSLRDEQRRSTDGKGNEQEKEREQEQQQQQQQQQRDGSDVPDAPPPPASISSTLAPGTAAGDGGGGIGLSPPSPPSSSVLLFPPSGSGSVLDYERELEAEAGMTQEDEEEEGEEDMVLARPDDDDDVTVDERLEGDEDEAAAAAGEGDLQRQAVGFENDLVLSSSQLQRREQRQPATSSSIAPSPSKPLLQQQQQQQQQQQLDATTDIKDGMEQCQDQEEQQQQDKELLESDEDNSKEMPKVTILRNLWFEVSKHTGWVHLHGSQDGSKPLGVHVDPLDCHHLISLAEAALSSLPLLQQIRVRAEEITLEGLPPHTQVAPGEKWQLLKLLTQFQKQSARIRNQVYGYVLQPVDGGLPEWIRLHRPTAQGKGGRKGGKKGGLPPRVLSLWDPALGYRRHLTSEELFDPSRHSTLTRRVVVRWGLYREKSIYQPLDVRTHEPLCFCCGRVFGFPGGPKTLQDLVCSADCLAYFSCLSQGGFRRQVGRRDRGVCEMCGLDTLRLLERMRGFGCLKAREAAILEDVPKFKERPVLLARLVRDPKEGYIWNADHIEMVAEGGGLCDITNGRALCVLCHYEVTKEQARLGLGRRRSARQKRVEEVRREEWEMTQAAEAMYAVEEQIQEEMEEEGKKVEEKKKAPRKKREKKPKEFLKPEPLGTGEGGEGREGGKEAGEMKEGGREGGEKNEPEKKKGKKPREFLKPTPLWTEEGEEGGEDGKKGDEEETEDENCDETDDSSSSSESDDEEEGMDARQRKRGRGRGGRRPKRMEKKDKGKKMKEKEEGRKRVDKKEKKQRRGYNVFVGM